MMNTDFMEKKYIYFHSLWIMYGHKYMILLFEITDDCEILKIVSIWI
jgi:hypothetical protein